MKASIVPIGNSKGIRIPKTILEQCHIGKEVTLEIEDDSIIIKPVKEAPRENWGNSFKRMKRNKDDKPLIDDSIDLDVAGWEW